MRRASFLSLSGREQAAQYAVEAKQAAKRATLAAREAFVREAGLGGLTGLVLNKVWGVEPFRPSLFFNQLLMNMMNLDDVSTP